MASSFWPMAQLKTDGSNSLQLKRDGLQPNSNGNCLHPKSDGLQPKNDGLQLKSDGLQPNSNAMASSLRAMASNLRAMASNIFELPVQNQDTLQRQS